MISKTTDLQQLIDYFVDFLLIGRKQNEMILLPRDNDSREDRCTANEEEILNQTKDYRTRHGDHSTIRSRDIREDRRYQYVGARATLASITTRELFRRSKPYRQASCST
jgi:hypothetical protein